MPPRFTPRDNRPALRETFARILEAGEALRAATEAYHEAVDRLPGELAGGLHAEVDGVAQGDVDELIDRLADLLGVPDDADARTTATTRKAAREALEYADRLAASELSDVVERLTGVVDARVTPALADLERELRASFSAPRRGGAS